MSRSDSHVLLDELETIIAGCVCGLQDAPEVANPITVTEARIARVPIRVSSFFRDELERLLKARAMLTYMIATVSGSLP